MFFDELTPLLKEVAGHPIAFLGGFFSGLLRLNLADDPVKSWLDQQSGTPPTPPPSDSPNGKSSGPKSISID
ncbi:MAG: hypothetical protein MUF49_08385 [Oculatellaceae cyanobacterium Prado106]|nr:hypothetical protein [Oculatellaceae cyanobacterium Prado106]